MNIISIIQEITVQALIAVLICIPLFIASAITVIYIDSLANCWRYLKRDQNKNKDVEIPPEPNIVYDPFRGEMTPVLSLKQIPAIFYAGTFILQLFPIVNTFMLIHSVLPFFEILKNIRRNPHLTMRSAQYYLKKNPEVQSKLYHSVILQFILKYGFAARFRLLFL
jgi:hypothetical protein